MVGCGELGKNRDRVLGGVCQKLDKRVLGGVCQKLDGDGALGGVGWGLGKGGVLGGPNSAPFCAKRPHHMSPQTTLPYPSGNPCIPPVQALPLPS